MFAAMHSPTNARVLRWLLFRCFCLSFLRDSCPLFRCLFLAKRLLFICSLSAIGVYLLYIYIHMCNYINISYIWDTHLCISHICPSSWLLHWCSWTNTSFKIPVRFLLGVRCVYLVFVYLYLYIRISVFVLHKQIPVRSLLSARHPLWFAFCLCSVFC